MKHPAFGDKVINTAAGERNPLKHGFFVKVVRRKGRLNKGTWYECTDGRGRFWQVDPRSIELVREQREISDHG